MNKLVPIVLDFRKAKYLNESFLTMFGATLKEILRRMFGRVPSMDELEQHLEEQETEQAEEPNKYNVKIKGSKAQIGAFLKALMAEKKYIEAYTNFGYEDERTREVKYELNNAVEEFEGTTGLIWPFN